MNKNKIRKNNEHDLLSGKIKKIAFTDSVHRNEYEQLSKQAIKIFGKISRNYVRSKKPVGTFIINYKESKMGTDCYSSGHVKHEYTSGYAMDDIFNFFLQKNENKEEGCEIYWINIVI